MVNVAYPPVAFHFSVDFEGAKADASFAEVSGISTEVATEELIEGGENRFKHRLPSTITHPNLVLKRGLALKQSKLVKWVQDMGQVGITDNISLKKIEVTLLDESAEPLMTWSFTGVYPLKHEIAALNAKSNEVLIETLEFSYQTYQVIVK